MELFKTRRERGRIIQNLRVVVEYRALPEGVRISQSTRNDVITFSWFDEQEGFEKVPYVDSESLRDAFLAAKTPEKAEAFLRSSGPFRNDATSLTWNKFMEWQEYFKMQRSRGNLGGWGAPPEFSENDDGAIDRIIRVPKFEPVKESSGQPILAARAASAVECIAAVNYLERWANTVVMSCRNCGDPFAPKTKASIFCDHGCAHAYWRAHGSIGERKGGKNAKASK